VFEGDKTKETSKVVEEKLHVVPGTMNLEMPKDCTEEELSLIQKVLEESIANSLGKDPKDVKVKVDLETGEAIYDIFVDDATLAEEIQKAIKADDFSQNINKSIDGKKGYLSQRLQEVHVVISGDRVDVNTYFF
jgi:hypothetical protein